MISEQVLSILVADNVEVACSAIEKAAMERAAADVDEASAASYEARRRHRELRTGQAFWDPVAPPTNFSVVPLDPLRIKATGLQPHQFAVNEDFCEYSAAGLSCYIADVQTQLSTPSGGRLL